MQGRARGRLLSWWLVGDTRNLKNVAAHMGPKFIINVAMTGPEDAGALRILNRSIR